MRGHELQAVPVPGQYVLRQEGEGPPTASALPAVDDLPALLLASDRNPTYIAAVPGQPPPNPTGPAHGAVEFNVPQDPRRLDVGLAGKAGTP
jgi:hypothetical protein